jgi:hypothetical protein
VPVSEAGSVLAGLLPAAIDYLSPDGKVPETSALENSLTSLTPVWGGRRFGGVQGLERHREWIVQEDSKGRATPPAAQRGR